MSTENPDEGNQKQPTGGAEPSTSSPSGSQQGQPLPEYVTAILSKLDEQDKFIKGIQKGTDKQIGRINNDIKRILELKEQGLNEQQIERELWIDAQIQNQSAPQTSAPDKSVNVNSQDRTTPAFTAADALAMAEEYGLSVNDPAVIAQLRDRNLSRDKMRDFILESKKPPKQPNPADVTQSPSLSQNDGSSDIVALQNEQSQLLKNPSKNYARLKEIRELIAKA